MTRIRYPNSFDRNRANASLKVVAADRVAVAIVPVVVDLHSVATDSVTPEVRRLAARLETATPLEPVRLYRAV